MMNDLTRTTVTEIYICRFNQRIENSRLEMSCDIGSRCEAASDAAERCRRDRDIARIFYYRVRDDGGFRSLYAHVNPEAARRRSRAGASVPPAELLRARELRRRQELSLWSRIVRAVGEQQRALVRGTQPRHAC